MLLLKTITISRLYYIICKAFVLLLPTSLWPRRADHYFEENHYTIIMTVAFMGPGCPRGPRLSQPQEAAINEGIGERFRDLQLADALNEQLKTDRTKPMGH